MTTVSGFLGHGDEGHELLYFVSTLLVGDDPTALVEVLDDHIAFLTSLHEEGRLVFAGPLATPDGKNTGNGIYALRASTLSEAQDIMRRDPMHRSNIRSGTVSPWTRKTDWTAQ
ncbi:MAG: YciI family protein [Pseudonocardiaceae bacterium]